MISAVVAVIFPCIKARFDMTVIGIDNCPLSHFKIEMFESIDSIKSKYALSAKKGNTVSKLDQSHHA